jgi:hypothetical protein
MTNEQRDEILRQSQEALKPLNGGADAEPRAPRGLPVRSCKEQDDFVAWQRQRDADREAAVRERRRLEDQKRENAAGGNPLSRRSKSETLPRCAR